MTVATYIDPNVTKLLLRVTTVCDHPFCVLNFLNFYSQRYCIMNEYYSYRVFNDMEHGEFMRCMVLEV